MLRRLVILKRFLMNILSFSKKDRKHKLNDELKYKNLSEIKNDIKNKLTTRVLIPMRIIEDFTSFLNKNLKLIISISTNGVIMSFRFKHFERAYLGLPVGLRTPNSETLPERVEEILNSLTSFDRIVGVDPGMCVPCYQRMGDT